MRIALISDIHGNLEALKAFEKIKQSYDQMYCLGDVVGYGPFPEECVYWVRERVSLVIQGNHERALFDTYERHMMNEVAAEHILWTKRRLSSEVKTFIRSWPVDMKKTPFWVCHGSPDDPNRYITGPKEVSLALNALKEKGLFIALFGHTHYPGVIDEEGSFWYEIGKSYLLKRGKRYLVNPGSIGQPRDGDPRASCCFLTSRRDGWGLEFVRYEYNISSTVEAMFSLGLRPELAYRLFVGR